MLPIQEALNRVTILLDEPDFHLKRQEIGEHLDTIIEYARSAEERQAAYDFKAMVLNHVDSVERDLPDIVEMKRVRAFKALEHLQQVILEH